MDEDVEHTRRTIAEQMRRELAACERLRAFVVEIVRPWRGRALDPDPGHDMLIATLLARSFNTFWAGIELVRLGFGEQAAMLNRSLFEDMVDAHWVADEPEAALERIRDHHLHGRMLLAEAIAKYPSMFPADEIPNFDPEERARLDAVFGRYGHKSWTTLNLHERVDRIEHHWRDEQNIEHLRFFRDIAHRENNQTLHVTAHGLDATVRARDDRGLTLKLGPGSGMLDRALFGAFWLFAQTVGLVLDHFAFEIDDTTRREVFDSRDFLKLSDADVRDVGRNDPCPCGSGEKYKRCHGQ